MCCMCGAGASQRGTRHRAPAPDLDTASTGPKGVGDGRRHASPSLPAPDDPCQPNRHANHQTPAKLSRPTELKAQFRPHGSAAKRRMYFLDQERRRRAARLARLPPGSALGRPPGTGAPRWPAGADQARSFRRGLECPGQVLLAAFPRMACRLPRARRTSSPCAQRPARSASGVPSPRRGAG